jgi:hypothetical protein
MLDRFAVVGGYGAVGVESRVDSALEVELIVQ